MPKQVRALRQALDGADSVVATGLVLQERLQGTSNAGQACLNFSTKPTRSEPGAHAAPTSALALLEVRHRVPPGQARRAAASSQRGEGWLQLARFSAHVLPMPEPVMS